MSFATSRERRSNAGNKMRSLLDQELEEDVMFQEEEDDVEFEANDEKDVVDSDFDDTSSDEEAEDEGEQQLQAEAKASRKRATAAAAKKPLLRTRPNPVVVERVRDGPPPQKKVKVNAPSVPSFLRPDSSGMRKSSRSHTVSVNKSVQKKLKEYQRRRSEYQAKAKPREETRPLTQRELLEEALITERENIESLNQWRSMEAEKKKASRVLLRKPLTGPVITYRSFREGFDKAEGKEYILKRKNGTVLIREYRQKKLIQDVTQESDKKMASQTEGKNEHMPLRPSGEEFPASEDLHPVEANPAQTPPVEASKIEHAAAPNQPLEDKVEGAAEADTAERAAIEPSVKEQSPPPNGIPPSKGDETEDEEPTGLSVADSSTSDEDENPPEFVDDPRQSRNVIILSDFDKVPTKYSIVDLHYEAIFGQGTRMQRATTVREKIARNRRPEKPICPISGVSARYRDPATNVPYANKECFGIIRKVLSNEYVWSTVLNAYVHRQDQIGASGVPDSFEKALVPPDADDTLETADISVDGEFHEAMEIDTPVKEELVDSPRSSHTGRRISRGRRR